MRSHILAGFFEGLDQKKLWDAQHSVTSILTICCPVKALSRFPPYVIQACFFAFTKIKIKSLGRSGRGEGRPWGRRRGSWCMSQGWPSAAGQSPRRPFPEERLRLCVLWALSIRKCGVRVCPPSGSLPGPLLCCSPISAYCWFPPGSPPGVGAMLGSVWTKAFPRALHPPQFPLSSRPPLFLVLKRMDSKREEEEKPSQ